MPLPVARVGADLRLLRAAVFTAVCVLLSAGGHVLASCASVPLWTLAAGFVGVFAAVLPLAGRERSLPGITAGLAVGQLALHTLFGLAQQNAGTVPRQAPSDGRLITFAARLICNQPHPASAAEARRVITDAGLDPAAHPLQAVPQMPAPMPMRAPSALDALVPSLPMLLGHLLAALTLGWLLRRGDVALSRVTGLSERSARGVADAALVRALRAALRLVRALRERADGRPAAPVRETYGEDERPVTEPALQHFVIRRGPPRYELAA
ncbi:hypothetical protein [Streptomyces sp. UNOC14_S4]|uniref:hypothetical protein n=1 Tax=Streptomyces sp. UNOC14_S4 TaxID=2872340 RepID=UPI001E3369EA|nr:hypothetical protein [Streptomyces sp. UNOC14_S4]MCC3766819.1 hypothetical protein [Streptomyces sp. UNOC14_S4]